MGTVDRNCVRPRGGTLAAGARPWHALTASLVVVCCFVWLCIRQCHELILKTRAERSQSEPAVAGVGRAQARVAEAANQAGHAFLAMTSPAISMSLNPVLGLAATLLVIRLDVQPRMPIGIPQSGDNFPFLLNDTLDLSKLETGRLELEQRAFLPESAFDQTVNMAGWSDQQAIGPWMDDHNGDGKVDILWQTDNRQAAGGFGDDRASLWQDGMPAIALMDGFNLQSGDNVGFNPGPAWQAHGAGDHNGDSQADIAWQNSDGTPAAWLGFNLVSHDDVGFNPATDWQEIQQYYDLL
jgi:hypothetical protein